MCSVIAVYEMCESGGKMGLVFMCLTVVLYREEYDC